MIFALMRKTPPPSQQNSDLIPEIKVFEEEGEFYLAEGLESALAYSLSDSLFIPVTLISGEKEGRTYVRMKNSL